MSASRFQKIVAGLRKWSSTETPVGGSATTAPNSGNVPIDLLDPKVLGKVGQLELLSQQVVDGLMSGVHRSTHKGGCCEFADHRPYTPGDEVRLVDWRMFARRDRYYVKQFEDETNLQAWMVVDCSGSMGFGASTATKFDFARMTCACIGRLLLKQRDAVGLAMQVEQHEFFLPAKPQANHFNALVRTLRNTTASGSQGIIGPLEQIAQRAKRRGLVLVFSDCFGPVEPLIRGLQRLRLRGHDVLVFQVLAPEEVTFQFRRPASFQDLEGQAASLKVNPGAVRKRYLENFEAFMSTTNDRLLNIGCDRLTLMTDQDLGDTLSLFLRRRMATNKR